MSVNQRLDFNQDMVDNFMLFLHNMQLQQNTMLSTQITQMGIFNSLIHNSARERQVSSRSSSLPNRRPPRIFLNRNNASPVNFSTFGSFLNSTVDVFPTTEQINDSTEIVIYNTITNPQNTICPIRNENFAPNDIVIKINHCGHIFYPNEFYGWFRNHVRCPMCRHDIRDSSNNTNIDLSNNTTTFQSRPQTQFDICYNIFGDNQNIIPSPSEEALNNIRSLNRNNSFSNLQPIQMNEIDFSNQNNGENENNHINSIAEITRTMAGELVNQFQNNNLFNDISNNQIEMSLSFMTPTVITRTATPFNDTSMNEID